ncbi:enoyl-CoA hydratase-related protein [Actinorhabdospora filicis]|uniref:enoyl-CoA hydratase-related protein n=1 Tax=Actinorhabdospora filicis TaxID=1785913 RepID=UPI0025563FF9|nr:enoyl-CoA hydratase-related protein [Actinorhabdospora filicis]
MPTDTPSQLVRHTTTNGVATITLDSDHNRNALSTPLMEQFLSALDDAATDDDARVVVLDHTGTVFCSGADLTETAAAREAGQVPAAKLVDLLAALWEHPKPIVAKVGGPARAGGLGLIAAADIAVCRTDSTFAFSEVRLGVIPAVISATVLRRLSPRAAAELYLTGEVFDGYRAASVGLVTRAVPPSELDTTVMNYVSALVKGAPGALSGAKALLRRRHDTDIRAELSELAAESAAFFLSEEGREGVAAFRERRDPRWMPPVVAEP